MDEGGRGRRLYRAQAQVQRAGEQVVIVVGVRVTAGAAAAAVLRRRAGRVTVVIVMVLVLMMMVQHVGGRVEVRVKAEAGKVLLEQRVGGVRGRLVEHVLLHVLARVLDQVGEMHGRVEQRPSDGHGFGHDRLLLVVVLMVVLVVVVVVMVVRVVVVMIERVSGTGSVRFEQRAHAERLGVLGGDRWPRRGRLCGRRSDRGGHDGRRRAPGHVDVRRRQPAVHVQLGRRGRGRRAAQRRPYLVGPPALDVVALVRCLRGGCRRHGRRVVLVRAAAASGHRVRRLVQALGNVVVVVGVRRRVATVVVVGAMAVVARLLHQTIDAELYAICTTETDLFVNVCVMGVVWRGVSRGWSLPQNILQVSFCPPPPVLSYFNILRNLTIIV